MAGSNPNFDPAAFRDNIRFAMQMGASSDPDRRVTFYWNPQRTFAHADAEGVPYDLSAPAATDTAKAPVVIDVGVQYGAAGQDDSQSMGSFDSATAQLTILDEDFAKVKDADYVKIGGDIYDIDLVRDQPIFDAAVYIMQVHARSKA